MDFSGPPRLTKARSMWSPATTHTKSPKLELSFLLNHQSDLNASKAPNTGGMKKENEPLTKKKERKFMCEQCPAAFTQSHDLSKHIWYVSFRVFLTYCLGSEILTVEIGRSMTNYGHLNVRFVRKHSEKEVSNWVYLFIWMIQLNQSR